MSEYENFIEKLKAKLNNIADKELVELINKLILEYNYLAEMASIDPLTGLNNRRIIQHIRKCDGVIMMDIDNFKGINDSYGHDIGDLALKAVAKVIKNSIRISDYAFRFGGDEFTIAFTDCPDYVIRARAEEIRKNVNSIKIQDRNITTSIGLAINDGNYSITELINNADQALYMSKLNGKNQVTEFNIEKSKVKRK